jgi:hypothetical protein
MIIKNLGDSTAIVESTNVVSEFKLLDSYISSVHTSEGESMSLEKPGEYEFKGVDMIFREISTDGLNGFCNICRSVFDGVRLLFLINNLEAKSQDLNLILDIDILIVTDNDLSKLDRLSILYAPAKVVVMQDKKKVSEIEDEIKTLFSTSEILVEKQLKTKEQDYSFDAVSPTFIIIKR